MCVGVSVCVCVPLCTLVELNDLQAFHCHFQSQALLLRFAPQLLKHLLSNLSCTCSEEHCYNVRSSLLRGQGVSIC